MMILNSFGIIAPESTGEIRQLSHNDKIRIDNMFAAEFDVFSIDKNNNKTPKKLAIYEVKLMHATIINHTFKRVKALDILSTDQNAFFYVSHNLVIKKAIEEIKKLLKMQANAPNGLAPKAKIYMAICDKQLCGVAVANVPKITKDGEIVSSCRSNPSETELDWLVTWPLTSGEKVKGVGKLLLSYVYDFARESNFKSLYIRAMEPKLTNAVLFYSSMGCSKTGGLIPYESPGMPIEIVRILDSKYKPYTGITVPMEISCKNASDMANCIFNEFNPVKLADTCPSLQILYDFCDIKPKTFLVMDLFSPYTMFKKIALAIALKVI